MSWLDDIVDIGKSAYGFITGNSTGGRLAKLALTGFALSSISKSVTKSSNPAATSITNTPDRGVRLQVDPDTQHKIPVVYGNAYLGGIITDAQLADENKTMYYAITICEQTGTKLSDDLPSAITFEDIYWNDQRLVFKSDGITVNYSVDRDSNIDYSLQNQVQLYCYSGSSTQPVVPDNYSATGLAAAYDIMPDWTSSYTMNDTVFVIVKVVYNKEKNVSGLGDIKFHLSNSMTQPGDCLLDYMTNTRYGAGIPNSEIFDE
jgi:hypothetical protein